MNDSKPNNLQGHERRRENRERVTGPVRLFVLGPSGRPVAERYCVSLDHSPRGIAVRTPGALAPGSRVIVVLGNTAAEIWLACVAHVHRRPDGSRVLGLERLEMPEAIAEAPWLAALRAVA